MATRLDEHRQKIWEIIQNECSCSFMSTTKWIKALESLHGLDLSYQVKLLDLEQPGHWRSAPQYGKRSRLPDGMMEGPYSPYLMLEIEWMDVTPRWRVYRAGRESEPDEHVHQIEDRLRTVGTPFVTMGSVVRIYGHQRRSDSAGE